MGTISKDVGEARVTGHGVIVRAMRDHQGRMATT
jgi:hypothetical protein